MYTDPGISFDQARFQPMRIMPVRHRLMGHPLLEMGPLCELAKRLEASGGVRAHNDGAAAATSFFDAPNSHPIDGTVQDTIRNIEKARAWTALHNIQNDPLYRTLVDEVLDYVQPMTEGLDPGMCHRAGWIFITSPGAITPYHLDHEHNFILQIAGKKAIHVFDPLDRSITSSEALERFHMKLSRELVVYKPESQARAHVFDAGPGDGAYMPSTSPHWVQNGDEVSITVSFTYYTKRTLQQKAVHRANYALRALGYHPQPIGQSPARDTVKRVLFQAQDEARRRLRKRPLDASLITSKYAIG